MSLTKLYHPCYTSVHYPICTYNLQINLDILRSFIINYSFIIKMTEKKTKTQEAVIIWLFSDLIFYFSSFAFWRIKFMHSFFFLLIEILIFLIINYEWPNLSTCSKVYWLVHSAAFTATRIQFIKVSQFFLKRIIKILTRKINYAFNAGASLFLHWVYSTFISVFITWLVHSPAILVFHS